MNANRGLRLGHGPTGSWPVRSQFDVKRPTLSCDLPRVVSSQSAVWRLLTHVASVSVVSGSLVPQVRIADNTLGIVLAVAPAQIEGLLGLVDGESVHPKCGGYGQIDPHCATQTPAVSVWRTGV